MYHHFRDKREISTEVYRTSQNAIVAKVIDAVLIDRPRAVVVDLSAVEFLGSAGLRQSVTANEKAEIPGRFGVVASTSAIRKPIEITELDQLFSLSPTLDDAVTSLRRDPVG